VGQRGGRLDLAFEAAQVLRVAGALGADELEGTGPAEEDVLGEVDLAHPALPEFLLQHVLTQFAGLAHLPVQDLDARARQHRDDRTGNDPAPDEGQTEP
jgi:hypothetical protein